MIKSLAGDPEQKPKARATAAEVRERQQALSGLKAATTCLQLQQFPPAELRRAKLAELDQTMHFTLILKQTRATLYALLMQPLISWQPDLDWPAKLERDTQTFFLCAPQHFAAGFGCADRAVPPTRFAALAKSG